MRRVLVAALASTVLAACTNSGRDASNVASPPSTIPASLRLGSQGGCAEVVFFAAGGSSLLVVQVEPEQRAADGSLEKTFTLPADGIHVELQRGTGLDQVCTDVLPDDHRVDSVTPAVSGTIVVTLDQSAPNPGMGSPSSRCASRGRADVRGLTLSDGTVVDDLIITGNEIGCTPG